MKILSTIALWLILGVTAVGAAIGALAGFALALPFIVVVKLTKAAKAVPAAVAVIRGPKGLWRDRLKVIGFILVYPLLLIGLGLYHLWPQVRDDWQDVKRAWRGAYLRTVKVLDVLEEAPELLPEREPEVPAPANDAPEAPEALPLAA